MTMADDYVNSVLDRMPLGLSRLTQIGAELRSHIAERLAAGHSLDDVLRQLGEPAALADSYLAAVPLVPAPFGRRIAAKLIDLLAFLLMCAVIVLTGYVVGRTIEQPAVLGFAFFIGLVLSTIAFGVYTVVAEWRTGRTLGKRLSGLRVVRESGARIGFGQSVVRQLPAFFQVFWIDVMFALFTDKRQRAFEMLSKTRVVDAAD